MTVLPAAPPALAVDEERRMVELALRPAAMRAALAEVAGVDAGARCQVVDAKYEARSHCTVLYELGPALVTLVVDLGPATATAAGTGGGREVGDRMRAYVFPEDPVLSDLGRVLDPSFMRELLEEPLGSRLWACRVEVLRYRPGKRATLAVTARPRRSAGGRPLALIAKVYANASKAAAVYEECRHLGAALASDDLVALAPVVAFVPQVPMVVQARVAGVPLDPLLGTGRAGREDRRAAAAVSAAGQALAAVHRARPRTGRARSSDAELARFAKRAGRIAEIDQRAGAALAQAVERLGESRRTLPVAPPGLVHGDCKPSQFLLSGPRVSLLDFDHVGVADPAYDIGAFLAALRKADVVEFLAGRRPGSRRPLERAFLDGYEPRNLCDDDLLLRVSWHQSAALTRKALRAFARAPRSPVAVALAAEAGRCSS